MHTDNPEAYPPIPQVHTVMLVNNFIVNTTEFVNEFASTCEEKLSQVSRRLSDVELTLALLEAKLNSVPGISDVSDEKEAQNKTSSDLPTYEEKEQQQNEVVRNEQQVETKSTADNDMTPAREHPTYAPYFKLQRLGVPEPQIKMKMQNDGVDPSVFDDPDRLLPTPASNTLNHQPTSGSSSSDTEEEDDNVFSDHD
mmetsp:Transcript_23417/g.30402  ORF Transcript_23417/g.30402 Transcript_23417/m.30402 type:complete len:197 (-) Transcript_23417:648-1238(-)